MTTRMKDPRFLTTIGLVCLIAFNLSNFIVRRWVGPSLQDWVDGASGLALGVAIATILIAGRLKGRQLRGDQSSPCA